MHDLISYIEAEQPKINDFLFREAKKLHPLVQPAVLHVLKGGGKRLRPLLALLTARGLGRSLPDIYPMACALEFLHSATLLHDDILDGAELRRGMKAAHLVFGRSWTILAGDALLALGNRLMASYGLPKLIDSISEAIMRTATGEIAEIAHIRNPELNQEQYLEIITGKTAYLIQSACACGAILAKETDEIVKAAADFGLNLGIAFQLVDDALDYSSSAETAGKPVGADLDEGKLTLPMLLFLKTMNQEEQSDFARRFRENDFSSGYLAGLIARVRSSGQDLKTREMAETYLNKAGRALALFPDSPEKDLLGQALDYVLTRQS